MPPSVLSRGVGWQVSSLKPLQMFGLNHFSHYLLTFSTGNWHFVIGVIRNCQWMFCIHVRQLNKVFSYMNLVSLLEHSHRLSELISNVFRENAGLLAMTRVGSRRVVQISAGFMIFFSVLGKFSNSVEFISWFKSEPCVKLFRKIWSHFRLNSTINCWRSLLSVLCVRG